MLWVFFSVNSLLQSDMELPLRNYFFVLSLLIFLHILPSPWKASQKATRFTLFVILVHMLLHYVLLYLWWEFWEHRLGNEPLKMTGGTSVEINKYQKLYLNYKFFSFLIVEVLVSYPLGASAFTCYPIVTRSSGYWCSVWVCSKSCETHVSD